MNKLLKSEFYKIKGIYKIINLIVKPEYNEIYDKVL